jgi:hypothetical protein
MKSGTSEKENLIVSNISAQSTVVSLQSPTELTTSGAQLRFEDGIEIGDSSTTTTGTLSIAIGKSATANATSHIAVGYLATTGYGVGQIALGYKAYTDSPRSIAIGYNAGTKNASGTGGENIAIGPYALNSILDGSNARRNVAIGSGAGTALTEGKYNTLLGRRAGLTITSGDSNVCIGISADVYAATNNDAIAIRGTATQLSIAIGRQCFVKSTGGLGIGHFAEIGTSSTSATCVGHASYANALRCVALGYDAYAIGTRSIAIGGKCDAIDINVIAIGAFAYSTGDSCISIGGGGLPSQGATGKGTASIAMGRQSFVEGDHSVAIGGGTTTANSGAHVIADEGIAIGHLVDITANYSIAIGYTSSSNATHTVSIGYAAAATTADQIVLGRPGATGNATADAWGQVFQNLYWSNGTTELASINETGDIVKGGAVNVSGNLDMFCNHISNVESIVVSNITSKGGDFGTLTDVIGVKSPLTFRFNDNQNTFLGYNSGTSSTSDANENTAIGHQALEALTTGDFNVAIGRSAGTAITTGYSCVLIGKDSGATITTANDNVCIGDGADVSGTTIVGATAIGNGIVATVSTGLFVGHRGPGAFTVNNAGFIASTNELVEVTSSRRFKTDIRDLESTDTTFDQFRPVRYRAKPGCGDDREHIGLIAEEVEEIYPELVTYEGDNVTPCGLVFDRLTAINIKEIQSLRKRVTQLELQNAELKSENTKMREDLERVLVQLDLQ